MVDAQPGESVGARHGFLVTDQNLSNSTALRHKFSLRKLGPYTSIFYLINKDGTMIEVRVAEHGWFGF